MQSTTPRSSGCQSGFTTPKSSPGSLNMPFTPDSDAPSDTKVSLITTNCDFAVFLWLEKALPHIDLDYPQVKQVFEKLKAKGDPLDPWPTLGELKSELLDEHAKMEEHGVHGDAEEVLERDSVLPAADLLPVVTSISNRSSAATVQSSSAQVAWPHMPPLSLQPRLLFPCELVVASCSHSENADCAAASTSATTLPIPGNVTPAHSDSVSRPQLSTCIDVGDELPSEVRSSHDAVRSPPDAAPQPTDQGRARAQSLQDTGLTYGGMGRVGKAASSANVAESSNDVVDQTGSDHDLVNPILRKPISFLKLPDRNQPEDLHQRGRSLASYDLNMGWAMCDDSGVGRDLLMEDQEVYECLIAGPIPGLQVDNQSGRIARTHTSEVVHAHLEGSTVVAKKLNLSTMPVAAAVSEARIMQDLLGCPAAVQLRAIGNHQGEAVLLLEKCEEHLLQWRQRAERSPQECIEMVIEATRLIMQLHAAGVAHLDVKPQNLLLNFLGCLKAADFGDALLLAQTEQVTSIRGTEGYQCCEMLRASPQHPVDACKADVWSLGCCLFELITGSPLFASELEAWKILQGQAAQPTTSQGEGISSDRPAGTPWWMPSHSANVLIQALDNGSSGGHSLGGRVMQLLSSIMVPQAERPSAAWLLQALQQLVAGHDMAVAGLQRQPPAHMAAAAGAANGQDLGTAPAAAHVGATKKSARQQNCVRVPGVAKVEKLFDVAEDASEVSPDNWEFWLSRV